MSQAQAPAKEAVGAVVNTDDYRSIWMYLKELEFRQGFVDISVNGTTVRTRYAEAGSPNKPHVVMLHGTGGHWETFAPNLAALSEHFHCVAIDMVGNGFSDKPDYDYEIAVYVEHVLGVMDHFGMASANFVAMSLGAFVASAMSVGHPDRVDKVILMSPAGREASAVEHGPHPRRADEGGQRADVGVAACGVRPPDRRRGQSAARPDRPAPGRLPPRRHPQYHRPAADPSGRERAQPQPDSRRQVARHRQPR